MRSRPAAMGEPIVWKKWILGVLVLMLAVAGFCVWRIGPRNVIGMLRYDQRREGALRVGDMAPDVPVVGVELADQHGIARHYGKRPVVLIFGSFT
jgi:hypothetical protein